MEVQRLATFFVPSQTLRSLFRDKGSIESIRFRSVVKTPLKERESRQVAATSHLQ